LGYISDIHQIWEHFRLFPKYVMFLSNEVLTLTRQMCDTAVVTRE
jgi:hypothetical protein